MNPVFVFLVILAAVFIWVLCAGLYKHIGKIFGEMFEDVKKEMKVEEENNEE